MGVERNSAAYMVAVAPDAPEVLPRPKRTIFRPYLYLVSTFPRPRRPIRCRLRDHFNNPARMASRLTHGKRAQFERRHKSERDYGNQAGDS